MFYRVETYFAPIPGSGVRPGGIALAAPIKYSFHVNGALWGYKIVFEVRLLPGDIVLCKKKLTCSLGNSIPFFQFFSHPWDSAHFSGGEREGALVKAGAIPGRGPRRCAMVAVAAPIPAPWLLP